MGAVLSNVTRWTFFVSETFMSSPLESAAYLIVCGFANNRNRNRNKRNKLVAVLVCRQIQFVHSTVHSVCVFLLNAKLWCDARILS